MTRSRKRYAIALCVKVAATSTPGAKPVLDTVENYSPWPTFSRKSDAFLAFTAPL